MPHAYLTIDTGGFARMSPNHLAAFTHQKYLNLETCRKTGTSMATPVWFAEADQNAPRRNTLGSILRGTS
jgi:hypothetical protein